VCDSLNISVSSILFLIAYIAVLVPVEPVIVLQYVFSYILTTGEDGRIVWYMATCKSIMQSTWNQILFEILESTGVLRKYLFLVVHNGDFCSIYLQIQLSLNF
jgi:hypothetical protein